MKAITIKQPWASLIIEGIKDVENRTWKTNFRGRVLVHAGLDNLMKKLRYGDTIQFLSNEQINCILDAKKELEIFGTHLYTGAIIGSVEIVDCVEYSSSIWAERAAVCKYVNGNLESTKTICNWVLANPVKFPEPIPAKGKLSFWDYPDILAVQEEEGGKMFCHCQLAVKEEAQVMSLAGQFECRYCGGIWYK